jgi:hypothetical protein
MGGVYQIIYLLANRILELTRSVLRAAVILTLGRTKSKHKALPTPVNAAATESETREKLPR